MEKVKLYFIETRKGDLFTRDTFSLDEFSEGQFTYAHDAKEYELPDGYSVDYTQFGLKGIFDPRNMYCELFAEGQTPVLVSGHGIQYLKKSDPTE